MGSKEFEELFRLYWERLFSYCCHYIDDPENATEIVQDIFTSIWNRKATLQIESSIEKYLFSAVRLSVANYYRKNASKKHHLEIFLQQSEKSSNNTLEKVMYHDLNRQVVSLVDKLPDRCKEVFELSRNKGFNIREIAVKLLISEKTVEAHLTKALRFLKENLESAKA